MTGWENFKYKLYLFWREDIIEGLTNFRRRIWNAGIKLWWYRLYIRRNEFHSSLNMDVDAMLVMDKDELNKYHDDITRRRAIAHNRDLAREDKR